MVYNTRSYARNQRITMLNKLNEELPYNSYDIKNNKTNNQKINKQYLITLFQKIVPNEELEFNIISRDSLDTKIKSEIISLEVDIESFSNEILSYKEISKPPELFNKYYPISEQPSSFKDISYSIKDYTKTRDLQNLLLNYDNNILKNVFIFDYFYNEKKEEVKIGFRFVFPTRTLSFQTLSITFLTEQLEFTFLIATEGLVFLLRVESVLYFRMAEVI